MEVLSLIATRHVINNCNRKSLSNKTCTAVLFVSVDVLDFFCGTLANWSFAPAKSLSKGAGAMYSILK